MIQRRVRVTSLREDLKAIGLLREGEEEPKPTDQDIEDEDDEEPAPDSEPAPSAEEDEDGEDDEKKPEGDLEKAMEALGVLAGGYLRRHAKAEHRNAKHKSLSKLAEGRSPVEKKRSTSAGKVEALLEDVSHILHGIRRSKLEQKIRGFANIALIADSLSDRFKTIGMRLSEGNLYRVARVMRKLSEQASDMAVGLDTPPGKEREEDEDGTEDPTGEKPTTEQVPDDDVKVDMLFKKFMSKLLDALQLYNDVTGQSESDAEPEDEPEPEAEPEEEDEDEPEGDEEPGDEPAEEGEEDPEDSDEPTEEDDDDEDKPAASPGDEKAIGEARKMLATLKRRYVRECSRGKALKREGRVKKESRAKKEAKKKLEAKARAKKGRR